MFWSLSLSLSLSPYEESWEGVVDEYTSGTSPRPFLLLSKRREERENKKTPKKPRPPSALWMSWLTIRLYSSSSPLPSYARYSPVSSVDQAIVMRCDVMVGVLVM